MLVDQRGTGGSNRLDCDMPDDALEGGEHPARGTAQAREACLPKLPGRPQFYTTSIAVRDLDAVRAALGYAQINLFGGSYGTRVAQHYARRYPGSHAHGRAGRRRAAGARARAEHRHRVAARARPRVRALRRRPGMQPALSRRSRGSSRSSMRGCARAGRGDARRSGHRREPHARGDARASRDDGADARPTRPGPHRSCRSSCTRRRPTAITRRSPRRPR